MKHLFWTERRRAFARALLGLGFAASALLACNQRVGNKSAEQTKKPSGGGESDGVVVPRAVGQTKSEQVVPLDVQRANYAITKLQLERAADLLQGEVGPYAALSRARLAVYQADCEGAQSHLVSETTQALAEARELVELAPRCARATAGSIVIKNPEQGVWIRLQDDADRVLIPLIVEVGVRARATLEEDLGETLPRPLRIDLVRDLFSLSAVSGLPLEAAETTGTVAVARWGRVTMVSPRAMRQGFPWADTLAHEITHLLISRATADRAPLWLQEGVAKREEQRWREEYPFDDAMDFSERAYRAQRRGKAIGIDQLGPSIAMLPSAEDASIAFAEVTSFIKYWIDQNGPKSLGLLLRDLEVARDDDAAMRSVSGYGVSDWQLLWRKKLRERFAQAPQSEEPSSEEEPVKKRQIARDLRMTELLTVDGEFAAAADYAAAHFDQAAHVAAFRFAAARAAMLGRPEFADHALGDLDDVEAAHAGWLALLAREKASGQSSEQAVRMMSQANGLDPLLPEVACGGDPWVGKEHTSHDSGIPQNSPFLDPERCAHARELEVRGSR